MAIWLNLLAISRYDAVSPTQGKEAWPWLTTALLGWAGHFWKVPGWWWGWQAGGGWAGVLELCMFSWIRKEDVVDRRHPSAHPLKKSPIPPTTHIYTLPHPTASLKRYREQENYPSSKSQGNRWGEAGWKWWKESVQRIGKVRFVGHIKG